MVVRHRLGDAAFTSAAVDGVREVAVKAMFYAGRCFVLLRKEKDGAHNICYARDLFREIQRDYPETIFLAEAVTRPAVIQQLAKLGFTEVSEDEQAAG